MEHAGIAEGPRRPGRPVTDPRPTVARTIPAPLAAGLIGAGHAVVAAAAVAGCLVLVQSGSRTGDLATQLVQASGIVALLWAYAGLVLGLLIGIRPGPRRTTASGAPAGPPSSTCTGSSTSSCWR